MEMFSCVRCASIPFGRFPPCDMTTVAVLAGRGVSKGGPARNMLDSFRELPCNNSEMR